MIHIDTPKPSRWNLGAPVLRKLDCHPRTADFIPQATSIRKPLSEDRRPTDTRLLDKLGQAFVHEPKNRQKLSARERTQLKVWNRSLVDHRGALSVQCSADIMIPRSQ